jgi:uncharacterized membrane protein YeaQ/YmgE (transglycosylase-associated protein family)
MPELGWISFLFVGLLAGFIAEKVLKRDHGLVTNLIVGVIGAYLGGAVFNMLGLGASGLIGAIVVATIGAILLLIIWGMIKGKRAQG